MLEEDTWRAVAGGEQSDWEWRAQIISKFIRPDDCVFDFGAGNRKLERLLPPSCRYVPIDAVDTLPGTFTVDFNKEFRLPQEPMTVAVCAGFLEYIEDVPGFFMKLREAAPRSVVLFSYLLSKETARSAMRVTSAYRSLEAVLSAAGPHIAFPRLISTVHDTVIIAASLTEPGKQPWQDMQSLGEAMKPRSKPGMLEKLARSLRKRIR